MIPKKEKKAKAFQLVKGMKDILPEEQRYWQHVRKLIARVAESHGFERIDLPIVEFSDLFVRGIGKATDIVEKEMYVFEDQGGDKLALRPEGTAGVVRSYIEHGMQNRPQPVKLYYFGPMFRHDKPQAGRYRQFYQFGFEILGESDAVVDAQTIMVAYKVYQSLNLPVNIQINSIGCPKCRPEYENELKDYLKKRKNDLSEISKDRLSKNPMRILDSKEKEDLPIITDAPQQIDFLCEDCRNHFIQVLEYLDELEIPYVLNPLIIRGLDYYSRTTFEIWIGDEEEGRQSALGGGGRYDGLFELLGGQPTPAIGFASGVERLINQIKENDCRVDDQEQPKIFLAQLGPEARKKALRLFENLSEEGIKVSESFSKSGLKQQLELANKFGVHFTLIIGQKEIVDNTVMIRDMENGIQEVVDFDKVVSEVKKRLEKSVVKE
ncbi:MAG: histidine--tRNA ligase [Candidatus Komeilibacteria bacterium CG10_big_fil_rev_8_21_14_0_10_41_13]|uniref:Histidine--tRNA ligase n=1 Tax=Candidatus Komeilibacteria bacterium CG10_big_fil_rev_8_21_14_0_10_41_13 TaxID=1974476 RepID=A0A2M6WC62_9BACT|nr:MAG: histidine--tRNA ligase [Candidatus Komeilibacteria bacterium CG10_big_fil_rev_8_21_14_0_10_41_13]